MGTTGLARVRIATRKSRLALWQAEAVKAELARHYPALEVELVPLSTRGDEIQDRRLSEVGGKALFLKELERALLDDRADVAVHSMKDVPPELDGGMQLETVLERGNPRDAFVSNHYSSLQALPEGARVGTSSLRREAQVRALRPDCEVLALRGNVNTRLDKLDRGDFDAIVLAAAGLQRLGLGERIAQTLAEPDWLSAGGQGAIGIEHRAGRVQLETLLEPLGHMPSYCRVLAERAVVRRLAGSCHVPIGAFARYNGELLEVFGLVGMPDGSRIVRAESRGPASSAERLGTSVAEDLLAHGAERILASL